MIQDKLWYKDAVFYQVSVRAFKDSNGDGFGDLRGLQQKLDYLSLLGIDCIWLMPIYPSPLRDDGYDISDYCNVAALYGNLDDLKSLVGSAHALGIRIIMDLVLNHTSDEHPWFQAARRAPAVIHPIGITIFGVIRIKNIGMRASSFSIQKTPIGPGMRKRDSIFGTASIPASLI